MNNNKESPGLDHLSKVIKIMQHFVFRNNPTFLACMLCSVMAIMKSYPALGDTALPLALLALWMHIFPCKPVQLI